MASVKFIQNIITLFFPDFYNIRKVKKYNIKYNIFLLNSYNLELPFSNTYCWCFLDEQITKKTVKENILPKFNVIGGLQYNKLI